MRFCNQCGQSIGNNDVQCPCCGTPWGSVGSSLPIQPPPQKKSKAPLILCIISLLALLAAVAIVLLPNLLQTEHADAQRILSTKRQEQIEEPEETYAQWEFDSVTGQLKIFGGDKTEDYTTENPAPWCIYGQAVKNVSVDYGVTYLGDSAFEGMHNLQNVTLPLSLQAIGDRCFANCSKMNHIYIPASVEYIGDAAFRGCASMIEFKVDSGSSSYCSVGGALLNKNCTAFIQLPAMYAAGEYVIPATVNEIAAGAFYGCRSLTGVTIPGSVREIKELTFYGCSSMTKLVLPMSVRTIRPSAFTEKMNRASDGTPVIACTAMKKIVYDGLMEWFYSINIGADNDNLFNAALHYVDPWDMPQSTVTYFETQLR